MDKHERVAEQYLVCDPILELADPAAYRREVEQIAAILRREYGSERNEGGLAKLCADQAKINERNAALEEAARACDEQECYWEQSEATYRDRDNDIETSNRCALRAEGAEQCAATIRALKDHIGDATVMIPRDVAETMLHYLNEPLRTPDGMETYRAEADGMDEELSALNEALGRKP